MNLKKPFTRIRHIDNGHGVSYKLYNHLKFCTLQNKPHRWLPAFIHGLTSFLVSEVLDQTHWSPLTRPAAALHYIILIPCDRVRNPRRNPCCKIKASNSSL